MPPSTVYVGRPSWWGNPYHVGYGDRKFRIRSREEAVLFFRAYAKERLLREPHWLDDLRGKNLACWCPQEQSCHADVLLELANK